MQDHVRTLKKVLAKDRQNKSFVAGFAALAKCENIEDRGKHMEKESP